MKEEAAALRKIHRLEWKERFERLLGSFCNPVVRNGRHYGELKRRRSLRLNWGPAKQKEGVVMVRKRKA